MLNSGRTPKPLTLAEFAAEIARLADFETSPFLAVAVSGGPDSMALAILADRWARRKGGRICALTVDHCLRPESSKEAGQVHGWLMARGIPHEVLVWPGEKPRTGLQEAARIARYRLLEEWCRKHGCIHLLAAHHRGDQTETYMIRRRARSGAEGLAGMSPVRELADCRVLRPLLGFEKERLVALLQSEGQPFITDPSNFNPAFERSRFRSSDSSKRDTADASGLLAEIRVLGLMRVAREQDRSALLAKHVSVHPAGFAMLDLELLSALPWELSQALLSAIAVTIGGGLYPPRRAQVARLCAALMNGRRGYTVGGCHFVRWRSRVLVMRELAKAARPARLPVGTRLFWDRRFEIIPPPVVNISLSIGYLGRSGVIWLNQFAPELRRAPLPRLLLPILPALWDEDGLAAVPHLGYGRLGAAALPNVVFRPAHPLTQAGFAVV